LISVVIPCYNSADTIAATIESVLSQEVETEIIVVNDGSTDGSADVLERLRPAIQVITTPNRGASAARNAGTELATGEFIQYIDSDDLLAPQTLAARVDSIERTKTDLAHTGWQKFTIDASGTAIPGEISIPDLRVLAEDA